MKTIQRNYITSQLTNLSKLQVEIDCYDKNLEKLKEEAQRDNYFNISNRNILRVYFLKCQGVDINRFANDLHKLGIKESFIGDHDAICNLTCRSGESFLMMTPENFSKIQSYHLKQLWILAVSDGYLECGFSDFSEKFLQKLLDPVSTEPSFISKWKFLQNTNSNNSSTSRMMIELFDDEEFNISKQIIIYPEGLLKKH